MPLDARFDVADLLVDERATHFLGQRAPRQRCSRRRIRIARALVWDAFFVFGPEAGWDTRPPEPLGRRSPVVEYMATLRSLLEPYLE